MLYLRPENSKKVIAVKPLTKGEKEAQKLHELFNSLTSRDNFLRNFIDYRDKEYSNYDLPWANRVCETAGSYMPSGIPLYYVEEFFSKYIVSLQLIADAILYDGKVDLDLSLLLNRLYQNQGQIKFVCRADEIPFDDELASLSKKIKGIKPRNASKVLGDAYPDFAMFWGNIYPLIDLSTMADECSLEDFNKANPNIDEIVPQQNMQILELINKGRKPRRTI